MWQGMKTSTVAVQAWVVVPMVERRRTDRKLCVEPGGQVASKAGQATRTGAYMLAGRQICGQATPWSHVIIKTCAHDVDAAITITDGSRDGWRITVTCGVGAVTVMVTVVKDGAGLAETLLLCGVIIRKVREVKQITIASWLLF